MSGIVLGTMYFGTSISEKVSYDILDRYIELGGEWLDTANCYSFWRSDSGFGGQSESLLGRWMTARRCRDQVKLSSKVGAEPISPGSFPHSVEGLKHGVVLNAIDDSLARLQVDSVDLYWAHMEDRTVSPSLLCDTFNEMVLLGKTSRVGLSNHPAWYAAAANEYARSNEMTPFSALQLRESYIHPRPDVKVDGENHVNGMMTPESKDYAGYAGVALWAYTPLLTGAYEHPERPLPKAYDHPGTYCRLIMLNYWARELQLKPSQLVVSYMLSQDPVVTPIVGVSSVEQLEMAMKASEYQLPDEVRVALDSVS